MSISIRDSVAKRYGWQDYNHFVMNEDSCQSWSFGAVKDIIELEQENKRLKEALELVLNLTLEAQGLAELEANGSFGDCSYEGLRKAIREVLEDE